MTPMYLPRPVYPDSYRQQYQDRIAGLDHNLVVQEGFLFDMQNMTCEDFPAIRTRKGRSLYRKLKKPNGFGSRGDVLYWVDGTEFWYNGEKKADVQDSKKTFAQLGSYLCILPDKIYYNVVSGEMKPLTLTWTGSATFTKYSYDAEGEAANVYQGNAIRGTTAFSFEKDEAIEISGASKPGNNRYATIREILEDGKLLVFDNNVFEEDTQQTITAKRNMPDMDYFVESGNRLWGCKGDEIYASYLGMPWRWYNLGLTASDSWYCHGGTDGDFTGACKLGGYPIFLKENHIHKVYGAKPSNFSALENAVTGLLRGCDKSIANAGENLFYIGRNGVVSYSGGIPYDVGKQLGVDITEGTAGSDGRRYYLSAKVGDQWVMYCYDTQSKLWTKEDGVHVTDFATAAGIVYYLDSDGNIYKLDKSDEDIPWMIETGDICDGGPDKCTIIRLQLRLEIQSGTAQCFIQKDSSGQWDKIGPKLKAGHKKSEIIPLSPVVRCDHYRIMIAGEGRATIYSISHTAQKSTML